MFETIVDSSQLAAAQRLFEKQVKQECSKSGVVKLGYQGGGRESFIHVFCDHDIWIGFADAKGRYWNAIGIGGPFRDGQCGIGNPRSG